MHKILVLILSVSLFSCESSPRKKEKNTSKNLLGSEQILIGKYVKDEDLSILTLDANFLITGESRSEEYEIYIFEGDELGEYGKRPIYVYKSRNCRLDREEKGKHFMIFTAGYEMPLEEKIYLSRLCVRMNTRDYENASRENSVAR